MTTTRSSSKMEEQLASLLEKMDRQAQIMDRQEAKMDEQGAQLKRLTEQAARIDAVEADLSSVKKTTDGRLTSVEGSLAGMERRWKTELAEREERLKHDLQEEMQTVRGTIAASRGLEDSHTRPTTDTRGERQHQRPASFDGKMPWEAYLAQFELVAEINRWSEAEKATHLAVSLKGAAATVLTNLTVDKRRSYATLTAALSARFGAAHQTELNRMRLKARTRGKEETLAELAEDVERLVRLAYPDATEAMVEVLAKDQFTDALPEEDTRLRIRQNKPATLKDALRIALELESCQLASKAKTRFVRGTQLEEEPMVRQTTTGDGDSNGTVVQQLLDALKQLGKERRGPRKPLPTKSRVGSRSTLVCWECQQQGHLRRHCPRLQKKQPAQPVVSHQGNDN